MCKTAGGFCRVFSVGCGESQPCGLDGVGPRANRHEYGGQGAGHPQIDAALADQSPGID